MQPQDHKVVTTTSSKVAEWIKVATWLNSIPDTKEVLKGIRGLMSGIQDQFIEDTTDTFLSILPEELGPDSDLVWNSYEVIDANMVMVELVDIDAEELDSIWVLVKVV